MTELLSNLYNTGIHHAAEVDAVYHQKNKGKHIKNRQYKRSETL